MVPKDYEAKTGTVTFAPGDTSEEIRVKVNGDAAFEADETFGVRLDAATNATITDDDAPQPPSGNQPPPPAANKRPDARSDFYRAREDTKLVVRPSRGILKNDRDPDSDTLRARRVGGSRHGRLAMRADGSFSYVPDRDYSGRDSFTYVASDGRGGVDRAIVRISVRAVPEPRPPGGGGGGSGNSISIK